MLTTQTKEQIEGSIRRAVKELLSRDLELFRVSANERSITHRLAVYLESEFPEYNVDCEYNRKGEVPKKVHAGEINPKTNERDDKRVFPDIIVHIRRTDEHNLLIIEAKASAEDDDYDLVKLNEYLSDKRLMYRFGCFIRFGVGEQAGNVSVLDVLQGNFSTTS